MGGPVVVGTSVLVERLFGDADADDGFRFFGVRVVEGVVVEDVMVVVVAVVVVVGGHGADFDDGEGAAVVAGGAGGVGGVGICDGAVGFLVFGVLAAGLDPFCGFEAVRGWGVGGEGGGVGGLTAENLEEGKDC
jgi:hypothetical protein